MVLVLCKTGSAQSSRKSLNSNNIEDIRHPFGPHKLARALQACLDRAQLEDANSSKHGIVEGLEISIDTVAAATEDLRISDVKLAPFDQAPTIKQDSVQSIEDEPIVNVQASAEADVKLGASETQSAPLTDAPSASLPTQLIKPVKSVTALASTAAPKPTPVTELVSSSTARRVLLVDDNAINLRLLQVGMKKRGYTSISSASDGLQAVNTYRALLDSATPPHIILMDLSMPILNGFEATRQIREIEAEYNGKLEAGQAPHHSLITALTGLASVRDQKEAYTAGVDSYIMKPVSFAKLTKLLEDRTVAGKDTTAEVVSAEAVVAA
jgi:CheY-like chemotaxis protein